MNKWMKALNTKFLISFQHGGRRWACNVLGHYDYYLQNKDPAGIWAKSLSPLKYYGTTNRWNILISHCNTGVGKKIITPKLYRFRPAVILIRHPAKVISSMYRGRKEKVPGFDLSIEDFAKNKILDFYIDYSNIVYRYIGQKNKLFVSYNKLYTEQFVDEKKEWTKVINFIFGSVNNDYLNNAIQNNMASDNYNDGVKRHNRTIPSELGQLTDQEKNVSEFIKPVLSEGLKPEILKFYIDNGYL